eukprot:30514-Ditylum_brightwellii.AAC.1
MPANCIEKATKELTAAVRNVPMDVPPDYVTAVQQLRAVLLNERASVQTQHPSQPQPMKEAPQCSPNQVMTEKTLYMVPTNSPALIPCDDDEIDPPTPIEDCVQPTQYHIAPKAHRKIHRCTEAPPQYRSIEDRATFADWDVCRSSHQS